MISREEFKKRVNILFNGTPKTKCVGCMKLRDKSKYYRSKYIQARERLEECEEILNLAIESLDLNKIKHKNLRHRVNNRKK